MTGIIPEEKARQHRAKRWVRQKQENRLSGRLSQL
jgi:hypothetical protein